MNTDQARHIVALHDDADRALANLRNAAAMATDDPRAPELLERAGDAYAEAMAALCAEQFALRVEREGEAASLTGAAAAEAVAAADGYEPGKAVWIVEEDSRGAGFVEAGVKGIVAGNIAVHLTTDAVFRGERLPEGATISVPTTCLSLEAPADDPPAAETPADGSSEGRAAAKD